MANQAPSPVTMYREALEDARRQGLDPHGLEGLMRRIHFALPDPPVSADVRLSALDAADLDGADRFSGLPDALLRNIISRVPVKDAARTAALSRRWRPIWRTAPLALVDAHLLPAGKSEIRDSHLRPVATAVSRILDAHSGPFRCVHLTTCRCYMDEYSDRIGRWLQLLGVKGVEELVLFNGPWRKPLPAAIFCIGTLTRLFLGLWRFPDTAGLPSGVAFPCLRELGLCSVFIDSRDIDFVLARSPELEILYFESNLVPLRLRLVSQSLRCVQIRGCNVHSIAVVDAPRLERLILPGNWTRERLCSTVTIGKAPALHLFACFEPGKHRLQVGNTSIKAGELVNPSAMVPTIKIFALQVRFAVSNDAKMLPSFLRCFPNIESLHIQSLKTAATTGKLNLKLWQETGTIECVKAHISLMVLYDFRGERSELAFLKFFAESAHMLKRLVIVFAHGCLSSPDEARSKLKSLSVAKWANERCLLQAYASPAPEAGGLWDLRGADFSRPDPFLCSLEP